MRTIEDFAHWVTDNMMSNIDVKECTNILEYFVKINEHIIHRINKKGILFHNSLKSEY